MKIKHRIISAISAAAAAFSLMSATGFAQNLKYDVNGDGFVNVNDALLILKYTVGLIKDDAPAKQNGESILDNYEVKWAYNTLTDKQRNAYAEILEGALENSSSISLYDLNITSNDLQTAFWACDYDNPQLLNVDNGYQYTYSGSRIYSVTLLQKRFADFGGAEKC